MTWKQLESNKDRGQLDDEFAEKGKKGRRGAEGGKTDQDPFFFQ